MSLSAASRRARVSGSIRSRSASASSCVRGGIGSSWAIGPGSLLRVDVDAEAHVAVRAVACGGVHGGARRAHRAGALARLDDHLEALAAAQAEQRRGAEHLGALQA